MLKRTKGRLLLALLVVTGLAGTLNFSSLTGKERKFAVSNLKESRSNLLKACNGLSEKQLSFRNVKKQSIQQSLFRLAIAEKELWSIFEATSKQPATPEKRVTVKFADEEIMELASSRPVEELLPAVINAATPQWKTAADAVAGFKSARAAQLKYTRTTTQDLRNRIIEMPFGAVDGYQFLLFISALTEKYTALIIELKRSPGFPVAK